LSVKFLETILSLEIERTKEPETLFRGNSMASKALDVYMKQIANDYMKEALAPVIKLICSVKKNCELDPVKLVDENQNTTAEDVNLKIKTNCDTICDLCTILLDSIFKRHDQVPKYHYLNQRIKISIFKDKADGAEKIPQSAIH
jgi:hypothetical protein